MFALLVLETAAPKLSNSCFANAAKNLCKFGEMRFEAANSSGSERTLHQAWELLKNLK